MSTNNPTAFFLPDSAKVYRQSTQTDCFFPTQRQNAAGHLSRAEFANATSGPEVVRTCLIHTLQSAHFTNKLPAQGISNRRTFV